MVSYSENPYSCITFQFQSPAQIQRRLVSSTTLRTKAQVVSRSRCSHMRILCCSFYIQNWSNNRKHWRHDRLGRWQCLCRSHSSRGKAISLTTHPTFHSSTQWWERSLSSCSWARRFRNSQYVDYRGCKWFTACDVCVCMTGKQHALCLRYYPICWWQWKLIWWQMRMRPLLLLGYLTTRHQASGSTRYALNNISRCVTCSIFFNFGSK